MTAPEPTSSATFEFGVDFEVMDCGWHPEHRGGFETRAARDQWVQLEQIKRGARMRAPVPVKRRVGQWMPDQ